MTLPTRIARWIAEKVRAGSAIGEAVQAWNAANPRDQAEDTLLTVSVISADQAMRSRVAAAYAKEQAGAESSGAEGWAYATAYWWAAAPGWAAAWDYALANGNADPGADKAVITDGMILAQVQAMLAPPAAPPPLDGGTP